MDGVTVKGQQRWPMTCLWMNHTDKQWSDHWPNSSSFTQLDLLVKANLTYGSMSVDDGFICTVGKKTTSEFVQQHNSVHIPCQ